MRVGAILRSAPAQRLCLSAGVRRRSVSSLCPAVLDNMIKSRRLAALRGGQRFDPRDLQERSVHFSRRPHPYRRRVWTGLKHFDVFAGPCAPRFGAHEAGPVCVQRFLGHGSCARRVLDPAPLDPQETVSACAGTPPAPVDEVRFGPNPRIRRVTDTATPTSVIIASRFAIPVLNSDLNHPLRFQRARQRGGVHRGPQVFPGDPKPGEVGRQPGEEEQDRNRQDGKQKREAAFFFC